MREAAAKCEVAVKSTMRSFLAQPTLYVAYSEFQRRSAVLGVEQAKLLELYFERSKRAGARLDEAKRSRLLAVRSEIDRLQSEYLAAVSRQDSFVELDESQIRGLASEVRASLVNLPESKYRLPLRTTFYSRFMATAHDAQARQKVNEAYLNLGGAQNEQRLQQLLVLRSEAAQILGYSSHAEYVLEEQSAKSIIKVRQFLEDIRLRLKPAAQKDLEVLLALKKEKNADAKRIENWDWRYYDNLRKSREVSFTQEQVRPYFPVDNVLRATTVFFGDLMGIDFIQMPAEVWHPDVRLYALRDRSSGEWLGHMYFDLFSREGKLNAFAVSGLKGSFIRADGSRSLPAGVLIGNWQQGSRDTPALLDHKQLTAFVHEFGHLLEQSVHKSRYESLGFRRDWVEVPAETLENYAWEPDFLKRVSSHHVTGKQLPDPLISSLIASRPVDLALENARQLSYALTDLEYHASNRVDLTETWQRYAEGVFGVPIEPQSRPQSNFVHFAIGSDSRYYSYLWSKVYAQDFFAKLLGADSKNQYGKQLRKWVFEPRGTYEPDVLAEKFLGRPVSDRAFIESLLLSLSPKI
ncbi:MAG: hypothetical protein H7Y22_03965 [Gemmatimonadaceae bacterium]|nr:hypothetical protein [Gloeobacterales cyanobacterium ES-bin-141]